MLVQVFHTSVYVGFFFLHTAALIKMIVIKVDQNNHILFKPHCVQEIRFSVAPHIAQDSALTIENNVMHYNAIE